MNMYNKAGVRQLLNIMMGYCDVKGIKLVTEFAEVVDELRERFGKKIVKTELKHSL